MPITVQIVFIKNNIDYQLRRQLGAKYKQVDTCKPNMRTTMSGIRFYAYFRNKVIRLENKINCYL